MVEGHRNIRGSTNMKPYLKSTGWVAGALLTLSSAQAELSIVANVSETAGLYSYSYQIDNFTAEDVSIVTLAGFAPSADAVQNLVAPEGYLALFDSGLGLFSFLEGTQFFAAGTSVGGFSFQSLYGPESGTFEAITVDGNTLTGLATVPATAIPEPSSSALIGAVLVGFFALRRRVARA